MTEKLDTAIRQEQILQTALELVGRHGLRGLNVGAVARQIGLVPSAIYRHFRSKDQVVDGILGLIRERLLENIRLAEEEGLDALQGLNRLLMRHIRLIRENKGILSLIFSEEIFSRFPERRARVYGIIKEYLQAVAAIVRQGQQEGKIRAELTPEMLAVMFLGLIQPAVILWHLSEGNFDLTWQAEAAWQVFSAAIGPEK